MKSNYFAHSLEDRPIDEWHLLEDHLINTAKFAKNFTEESDSGE